MYKIDEFCIKNEKFCINNDESCIKNEQFCISNDEYIIPTRAGAPIWAARVGAEYRKHTSNPTNDGSIVTGCLCLQGAELLAAPMAFSLTTAAGHAVHAHSGRLEVRQLGEGVVAWSR